MTDPIAIVGGGLAGLTAARRLYRAGIPFKLIEARMRLGGRILSVGAGGATATDGFDLGPSWFWPGTQPALDALVTELGLTAFPQNSEGDIVVHRMSREAPQRYRLSTQQTPQSMRLVGGSGALIAALAADLPAHAIRLGARVAHVSRQVDGVEVQFTTASGPEETMRASHVLFALPPRLLEATVSFSPALDTATVQRWRATPTWMAPHAKVFALYDKPFWREAGLSGTAQSMAGPLVEIHDATTASGRAALFGFFGVPAEQRGAIGQTALVAAALQQLVRLFGPQAASPSATLFKDWAADPLTATAADRLGGGHPVPSGQRWIGDAWRAHLSLAGSETAEVEPGYPAGAVDAAERAVAEIYEQVTIGDMKPTYRAMQVTTPGTLELVERKTPAPGAGEVLIAVDACGICGADLADIDGADPSLQPPRVPGHEIVGRILALGEGVPAFWRLNQRVGVGRLGGHCNACVQCRQGQFQLCRNQPFVGSSCDGGYAEMMLARATGLVSIPDELSAEEAAPILCAGIATFNALKKSGAEAGDLVAVLGIGGLGHMALQYARKMGFNVVAVGRGQDIAGDAYRLGAHVYIDTNQQDAPKALAEMGGAQAIIATIGKAEVVSPLVAGLAPNGRLVLLGGGKDPLAILPGPMVVGERSVLGSLTGSPFENEKTLKFSVLSGVRPLIETMPLEQAPEALRRLRSGDARFRIVLTVRETLHADQ